MKTVIDLDGSSIEVADNTPVKTLNGIHYILSTEEQAELEARDAEWIAGATNRQADKIRIQRTPLLEEADVLIFKAEDAGQSTTALRAYRQALRDVTTQADIFNISWPVKPE